MYVILGRNTLQEYSHEVSIRRENLIICQDMMRDIIMTGGCHTTVMTPITDPVRLQVKDVLQEECDQLFFMRSIIIPSPLETQREISVCFVLYSVLQ